MILSNPFMVDPRVYKEAESLVDAGHEVTVIVWDRKNEYNCEDIVDGIKIIRVHPSHLMRILPHDLMRNPLWWKKAYEKGIQVYNDDFQFDIIHCHDLDTLLTGVCLKKKLNVKLVYDAHEIFGYMISRDMPHFIVKITFLMEKLLIKKVDRIITVNEPLKDYCKSISDKPVTIIMNCKKLVNHEYVPPQNKNFSICYIGVLNKARMFPELVNILGSIENIQFVIAGKKENLYEEVKKRSEEYSNVDFLGTIGAKDVIPQTLMANVIICLFDPNDPNNKVGLPNKIFESMVTGRPIIVTKDLYLSKFIEREKCGISIEYTPEEIRKCVIDLRDNPKLCEELGRNGLKAAKEKYNWDKQKEKLLKVYEGLK